MALFGILMFFLVLFFQKTTYSLFSEGGPVRHGAYSHQEPVRSPRYNIPLTINDSNNIDPLGNNLLHIVCRHGHTSLLPWLASRLGPELDNALGDENKRGLIPVTLAIKVR